MTNKKHAHLLPCTLHLEHHGQFFYPLKCCPIFFLNFFFAINYVQNKTYKKKVAPSYFQQGENSCIIYVHVPAARMSLLIYIAMAKDD
jgi:hypothetical protein